MCCMCLDLSVVSLALLIPGTRMCPGISPGTHIQLHIHTAGLDRH